MSNTQIAEVTSSDPFVQQLGRRAIRLLNDPTLDRRQREMHIRKLQSILIEHQVQQAAKANRLGVKKSGSKSPQDKTKGTVADSSQIGTRRREFAQAKEPIPDVVSAVVAAAPVAAIDVEPKQRLRSVLRLKQRQ